MCEMENAAEQIVDLAIQWEDWNISMTYDKSDDKNGFLQLIYYGWLAPFLLSKKEFGVTQNFIDRVTSKCGSKLLSVKPLASLTQLLDKRFNLLGSSPPIGTEPL